MRYNLLRLVTTGFALLILTQCDEKRPQAPGTATAPAPATAVPAGAVPAAVKSASGSPALVTDGLSPAFLAVASHLELGGRDFSYNEAGGTMALAGLLDRIMQALPVTERKGLPADFTVTKVFQMLGLDCITAAGSSVRRRADHDYHSRAFVYTPGGRKGLVTLSGNAAAKLMLLDLAPQETDLALEFPLYLKGFSREVLAMAADFMPAADKTQFEAQISQPLPQVGVSIREILEKTDARVGIYLKLDPSRKMKISPDAPELPLMDGLIVIERLGWLVEKVKPQIVQMFADPQVPATLTDEGGVLTIRAKQPAGPAPMDYLPVLRFDPKADRIIMASRPALLDSVIAAKDKFSQRTDFAEVWRDLPSEGNACLFASPRLLQTAGKLIGEAMKASKQSTGDAAMVALIVDWFKPLSARGHAVVMANHADGVLMASNTSIPMNSSITALTAAGVLAGIAVPVLTRTQVKAEQMKEFSDANQVISALELYALEHHKYPAELSDLVKEKALQNDSALFVTDPATKERKPWFYNNKLSDSDPGTEVLLASPPLAGGKRIVGFHDGNVRTMSEDEFKALQK